METLNGKWLSKLHGRKMQDLGLSDFIRILEYVASRYGTTVVRVDRFFPSSQKCSVCGEVNPAVKNLRVREWNCPHCKTHHDRDRNAAVNILAEGFRMFEAS